MSRLADVVRERGRMLLGVSVQNYNPVCVELAGLLGYDVVWIELEHGLMSLREAGDLCRVAAGVGILTMIRIPDSRRQSVLKAAECGPDILDLPMANTPEIAAELVQHARYQPEGNRGFFGASRAVRYGMGGSIADEQRRINRDLCLMIQIETQEAVANSEALCHVPGIDAIFLGPGDLSTSLGVTGKTSHPKVQEAMERAIGVAKANGKLVAMANAPDAAAAWAPKGVDVLFCGSDVAAMRLGLEGILRQARG